MVLLAPAPGILFGSISIKLIDLSILGISFLFLCYYLIQDRRLKNWITILKRDFVVLFLIISCLSVTISTIYGSILFPEDTALTDIYELYRYVYYFTFYLFALFFIYDLNKFISIAMWTILTIELFGIVQFFNLFNSNNHIGLLYTKSSSLHMMIVDQQRITSTLGNPNVYGSFLLIVLIGLLSILYMYKITANKHAIMLYSLTLLTIVSLFLTTSRTTVITGFGIVIYIGLYQLMIRVTSIKKILIKTTIALLVFVGIGFILIPHIPYLGSAVTSITNTLDLGSGGYSDNHSYDESDYDRRQRVKESLESVGSFKSRYYYWEINIDKFKQSPIVGIGPMKQGLSFADNTYLYILARYGILGMIVYGLFLIYLLVRTFLISINKRKRIDKKILAATINSIVVAYAVMGYVAESFFNIESMIVFFVLIGLLNNKELRFEG